MVRPEDANLYDDNIRGNRVKIIAQSGVEAEINIGSVTHDMKLPFNKQFQDREVVANVFSMNLVEPGGATLYTRIFTAAQDLKIKNHLKACYLLELRFLGYDQSGAPIENITVPYYWMCTLTGLSFAYSDGATTYRADFIETTQDAFKKMYLHLKEDLTISATNFGEFLDKLSQEVNDQEIIQTVNLSLIHI